MQQSLLNALVLGLLATTAVAAPTIEKRSFKVERVKNRNFKGHNGPRQLAKAYQKFNLPVPDGLLAAIQAQEQGVVDVSNGRKWRGKGQGQGQGQSQGQGQGSTDPNADTGAGSGANPVNASSQAPAGTGLVVNTPEQGDVEYLAPVTIGGQTVNLDFDSGSSDLWVFNTQLASQQSAGHTLFDPTQSKTFKMLQGASFSVSYGDGSGASGNVGTDVVNIGGAVVQKQAVELATQVSGSFTQDTQTSGLVGLAFSKLNTVQPQQQKTFFDNVLPQLAEPVFTADLRHDAAGAYEFGRIDSSKFTGEMAWIPVNTEQGFWQFSTSGFAVGDNQQLQQLSTSQAIADTGTTLMIVSNDVAQGYYSQVQGAQNDQQAGGFTIPCDATLPDLLVDVGGVYTAVVKGEDINFSPVSGNSTYSLFGSLKHFILVSYVPLANALSLPSACFGGVQATTQDLQIWGDIFFKSQFIAFNGGNNTLGMAQHA